jgi:hypothetical protein
MQDNTLHQRVLKVLIGLWLVVFLPVATALIQVIAALPRKTFLSSFYDTFLGWFFLPGRNFITTVSVFAVLTLLTIVAALLSLSEVYSSSSRVLRKYLNSVANAHQGLNPKGFAQRSQALLSVNVPLDDVYIHLSAVPDRPLYDMPHEQLKLLAALRQEADMEPAERERRIQDLRRIWASHELAELRPRSNANIEEILQRLTVANPVAVLLGAPGSGKSTTLRWFALHMAQACLLPWYRRWVKHAFHLLASLPFIRTSTDEDDHWHVPFLCIPPKWAEILPPGLAPVQIPILLRISEYASRLSSDTQLTFEHFFKDKLGEELAHRLLQEMEKGHCLLLFDGLDEVASDSLRRRVADNIATFIAHYATESTKQPANRFVITSRIVGYEAETFSKHAHYTLLEFDDKQIEQFLTHWCPAVERYQAKSVQAMKEPTAQQNLQLNAAGMEQKERLLRALHNNPGIKRLAVNPLMLTILALIQKSGTTLPHRRIDLYEVVTRTLLDNWNQETGRKVLPGGEIQLAERLLSSLAYQMHRRDPLITEREVKQITCQVMGDFYKRTISDEDIQQFIATLRSSSGLFVESGQGLFSFMHRTFQEYYVALYLLDKQHYSPDQLKQFVCEHYSIAIWREPLLLTIAYKSGQRDRDEQQQANSLIQAIMNTRDSYDGILHRSLLFAANSIVDCTVWSIIASLQQRVANALFTLYGDAFDAGRYTALQKDIEDVALLWLRGQPEESSQHTGWTPLLEAWRTALYDIMHPVRQEGAVHLLASLAPDLASCSRLIFSALLPPLLQLADVVDISCPPDDIAEHLPQPTAQAATQRVVEYAFITLRLLDVDGPANWLHTAWHAWNTEKTPLLKLLTQHSLQIGYLLTPAAFPGKHDDPHWDTQLTIRQDWQKLAQPNQGDLQVQLLQASNAANYPQAFLLWQMLTREEQDASSNLSWQEIWHDFLKAEMSRGRDATYQTCLYMRLLLARGDEQLCKQIADELVMAPSSQNSTQKQALITITNLYLADLRYMRYMLDLLDFLNLHSLLDLRGMRDLLGMHDLVSMLNTLGMRDLRDLLSMLDLRDLRHIRYLLELLDLLGLLDLLDLHNLRNLCGLLDRVDLRDLLNQDQIIYILCSILLQQTDTPSSMVLFAMYSVITSYQTVPGEIEQQVQRTIHSFEQQARQEHTFTAEHRQLIAIIKRVLNPPVLSADAQYVHSSPDARALALYALKQQRSFAASQIEELLNACTDNRQISEDKRAAAGDAYSVQQVAWGLLEQQFLLEDAASSLLLRYLDDNEAIVCAAAARLLQGCKGLPSQVKEAAAQQIKQLLLHETRSCRPLDTPDYRVWRLDDVLFETLPVLV